MKALYSNPDESPLQLSAILGSEIYKSGGGAGLLNRPSPLPQGPHRRPPLSPNRAFARGNAKPARRSRFGEPGKSLRRQLSVLVVDDVPDVAEMIALLLKHAGYDVKTADSAPAALQLAGERDFDLVISDIGMPEMNGYDLAGALRTLGQYQEVPIIAVTGYSEYDDRGRALQAGFTAHLTKPIDPVQLLDLMNQLLA